MSDFKILDELATALKSDIIEYLNVRQRNYDKIEAMCKESIEFKHQFDSLCKEHGAQVKEFKRDTLLMSVDCKIQEMGMIVYKRKIKELNQIHLLDDCEPETLLDLKRRHY